MGNTQEKFKPAKKVMVFGTFDPLHEGHKNFFRQAKKYGDFLIVVVARDRTVAAVKDRLPRRKEKSRLKAVTASRLADKTILGNIRDKYAIIRKYRPEVICLGYDQKNFTGHLRAELRLAGLGNTRVYRLKPYKSRIYKSSRLRAQS